MTRIVSGSARGRRLRTPRGSATRPTADRVREALFSALEATLGGPDGWSGVRLLDLYAGSGAVALEALSRGAQAATAVESDRRTAALVRANGAELGLGVEVVASTARAFLGRDGEPYEESDEADETDADGYDVVFADPPYDLGEEALGLVLQAVTERGWLAPGALLVVERSARSPTPAWPVGVIAQRTRRYGETALHYAHRA